MYIKAASYYIDGNDTGIWYAYFVIFDRRMFRPCSFLNVLHHSARCSRSYKCYIFEIRNDRSTADKAAGVIHTDFEKGFIKAETISFADYIKYGSELACKDAGKIRFEGRDYIMQDGDIMHFRFNV